MIATTTVQNPQGSIVSDTWIDVTFTGTLGTAAPTVGEDLRLRMTARATVPFRSAFVDDVRVLFVLPPNSAP